MLEVEEEKLEKWFQLVEKYSRRLEAMDYEFYPLDHPSMLGKIEQAIFVFEVLELYQLLNSTIHITDVKEYNEKWDNMATIDGFQFRRDGIPYYIALTNLEPPKNHKVIYFGEAKTKEQKEKENDIMELFGLFDCGSTIYSHFHGEMLGE